MGYINKGLVQYKGAPLIAHVVARLLPQASSVYISANEDLEKYAAFGCEVIQDAPQWRGKGPLAGIASVLEHLSDETILQVVSCDGPLIPKDLVAVLQAARNKLDGTKRIVYPKTAEREHYLYLQGEVKELKQIYALLAQDDLRIRALLQALSAVAVEFDDERAFVNCNSPQDIERLEEENHEKL